MKDDKQECEKLQSAWEKVGAPADHDVKWSEAIKMYKKVLGVIEAGPASNFRAVLMGFVHGKIGSLYEYLSRYDEAKRKFKQARVEMCKVIATAWSASLDKAYSKKMDEVRSKLLEQQLKQNKLVAQKPVGPRVVTDTSSPDKLFTKKTGKGQKLNERQLEDDVLVVQRVGAARDKIYPKMVETSDYLPTKERPLVTNLSQCVPNLLGRESDIEDLHKLLWIDGAIASLVGPDGVGKSELACSFARDWLGADASKRLGFWLSAASENAIQIGYLRILDHFGVSLVADGNKVKIVNQRLDETRVLDEDKVISTEDYNPMDVQSPMDKDNPITTSLLSGLVWNELNRTGQDFVVVFDNVPDGRTGWWNRRGYSSLKRFFFPKPLRSWDLYREPLHTWGHGRILITTADESYAGNTTLGHVKNVIVDKLSDDAIIKILLENIDGDAGNEKLVTESREAAKALVGEEFFDGLPLAISTANSVITAERLTIQRYLGLIKAGINDVVDAVDAAFNNALLVARQTSDDVKYALNVAAFVDADHISLDLLGNNIGAVSRLCNLNLLRRVGDDMYSMHPLPQEAARMGASPSDAIEAIGSILLKCHTYRDMADKISHILKPFVHTWSHGGRVHLRTMAMNLLSSLRCWRE